MKTKLKMHEKWTESDLEYMNDPLDWLIQPRTDLSESLRQRLDISTCEEVYIFSAVDGKLQVANLNARCGRFEAFNDFVTQMTDGFGRVVPTSDFKHIFSFKLPVFSVVFWWLRTTALSCRVIYHPCLCVCAFLTILFQKKNDPCFMLEYWSCMSHRGITQRYCPNSSLRHRLTKLHTTFSKRKE